MVRAPVKAEEFEKLLGKERQAVYLFTGPDTYGMGMALQRLAKEMFGDEPATFNSDTVYAGETSGLEIAGLANTVPLLADCRLVVVKGCEKLKKDDEQVLAEYIKDPNTTTTLVLLVREPDMRRKLYLVAAENGMRVEFAEQKLRGPELQSWVRHHAGELGMEISSRAIAGLIDAVGPDHAILDRELEKLSLYAGGRREVDVDDVEALVGPSRSMRIFDLTDALAERHPVEALKVLAALLGHGEDPIRIVAMLAWQLRRLWVVKEALGRGAPPARAASAVGIRSDWAQARFVAQARKFRDEELERAFEAVLAADLALKSSAARPRVVLELLLARLSS